MKIFISTQILSGNLGDGWSDNNSAADALSEMTEGVWRNNLSDLADEGHEIEIDIDVRHNTCGYHRGVSVNVDGGYEGWRAESAMVDRVSSALTDENEIWDRFCSSDVAETLQRNSGTRL